jgi:hypothetical protein
MEMSQENTLYLKQTKMSFCFFTKTEQEGKTGPAWDFCYQWDWGSGEEMGKEGEYNANTVYT